MLFEFEVTVIESDTSIRCFYCGKGFRVGSNILARGHALFSDRAYSEKYRIYRGSEVNRLFYHKNCKSKEEEAHSSTG